MFYVKLYVQSLDDKLKRFSCVTVQNMSNCDYTQVT